MAQKWLDERTRVRYTRTDRVKPGFIEVHIRVTEPDGTERNDRIVLPVGDYGRLVTLRKPV